MTKEEKLKELGWNIESNSGIKCLCDVFFELTDRPIRECYWCKHIEHPQCQKQFLKEEVDE